VWKQKYPWHKEFIDWYRSFGSRQWGSSRRYIFKTGCSPWLGALLSPMAKMESTSGVDIDQLHRVVGGLVGIGVSTYQGYLANANNDNEELAIVRMEDFGLPTLCLQMRILLWTNLELICKWHPHFVQRL